MFGLQKKETLTDTGNTLQTVGVTILDASSANAGGTLGDGTVEGQLKLIIASDTTNTASVTVTNMADPGGSPASGEGTITFTADNGWIILMWVGDYWVSVARDGANVSIT